MPQATTRTYARWPTLLDPWVEGLWRDEVERLPKTEGCEHSHDKLSPERSLRISGINHGSVLRPRPGQTEVSVRVHAIGSDEPITWLLNGRTVGTTPSKRPDLKLTLAGKGTQTLTAIDAIGRYERVEFKVR
jgi:penicillin-binding protein 1C